MDWLDRSVSDLPVTRSTRTNPIGSAWLPAMRKTSLLPIGQRRADRVAIDLERGEGAVIEDGKTLVPTPRVDAHDPTVGVEAIPTHRKHPLGQAKLGLGRIDVAVFAVADPIQVPPAGAIGDKVQFAIRRPLRLEDGLVDAAGNPFRLRDRSVGVEGADPEFRAVPRHVGMVPGEPSKPASVRADPRRSEEVVTRDDHLGSGRAVCGKATNVFVGSVSSLWRSRTAMITSPWKAKSA